MFSTNAQFLVKPSHTQSQPLPAPPIASSFMPHAVIKGCTWAWHIIIQAQQIRPTDCLIQPQRPLSSTVPPCFLAPSSRLRVRVYLTRIYRLTAADIFTTLALCCCPPPTPDPLLKTAPRPHTHCNYGSISKRLVQLRLRLRVI